MTKEKLVKNGLQVSKRDHCRVGDADLQIHGPFKEVQCCQDSARSTPNDLFALKRLSAWANKLDRSS